MTDQANRPQRAAGKARRKAGHLILLVLLGSAIFAAWQVHIAVFDKKRDARRVPPTGARLTWPDQGARSLDELRTSPLAAEGIEPLDGDPGGIRPPAGAIGRGAERFVRDGYLTERASYDVPGSVDEVLAYYGEALAQNGLSVVYVRDVPAGGKMASFSGADGMATVTLRRRRGDDRIVRIIIMVEQPAGPADGNR